MPFICHVMVRARERCPANLVLTTNCNTWESRSCTVPAQHSRFDPIHRGANELFLSTCVGKMRPCPSSDTWWCGTRRDAPIPATVIGRTASPEVIREGELSLFLTSYSNRESGPHTLLGQHSRAGPNGIGVGEHNLRL